MAIFMFGKWNNQNKFTSMHVEVFIVSYKISGMKSGIMKSNSHACIHDKLLLVGQ